MNPRPEQPETEPEHSRGALWPLILGLAVGAIFMLLWPYIRLPFSNPQGLVGPLTEIEFNPTNNILRFLLLVLAPAACLALLHYLKLFPMNKIEEFETALPIAPLHARPVVVIGCILILYWNLIPAASLLTESFPTGPLDIFHEGESLTPAFNYLTVKGLWTKSFFVHGLVWDPLGVFTAWKVAGEVSIGAGRLFRHMLAAGLPLFSGLFIVSLTLTVREELGDWGAALCGLVMLLGYMASPFVQYLDPRDIPVLLALSIFLFFLRSGRRALLVPVGVIAALQWFVTIERAAYVFVGLMAVLIWRGLVRATGDVSDDPSAKARRRALPLDWRGLGLFLAAYFATVLAVFSLLGFQEFKAFLDNLLYFSRYKDYFDSYIFPSPVAGEQPIHSLAVFFICLQWLLLVRAAVSTPSIRRKTAFHVALLLAVLSLVYFRSGLGRSDPYHIRYASFFAVLGLCYQLAIVQALYLRRLVKPAVILLLVLAALVVHQQANQAVFNRLYRVPYAPQRMAMLVNLPDRAYLAQEQIEVRDFLKAVTAGQNCFFTLTSEAAWPYLLRKPSCSKYYIVWFASAHARQKEIMADIEATRPEFILFDSPAWPTRIDGITQEHRFQILRPYLLETYRPFVDIHGYRVFRRIDASVSARAIQDALGWQRNDPGTAFGLADLTGIEDRQDLDAAPRPSGIGLRTAGPAPYLVLPALPRSPAGLKVLRLALTATAPASLTVDFGWGDEEASGSKSSLEKALRVGDNDVLAVLPAETVGRLRIAFSPGAGECTLREVRVFY